VAHQLLLLRTKKMIRLRRSLSLRRAQGILHRLRTRECSQPRRQFQSRRNKRHHMHPPIYRSRKDWRLVRKIPLKVSEGCRKCFEESFLEDVLWIR